MCICTDHEAIARAKAIEEQRRAGLAAEESDGEEPEVDHPKIEMNGLLDSMEALTTGGGGGGGGEGEEDAVMDDDDSEVRVSTRQKVTFGTPPIAEGAAFSMGSGSSPKTKH